MCKNLKRTALSLAVLVCISSSGCGVTEWIAPQTETTTSTQTTTSKRTTGTTKTARPVGEVDADDEDFEGYTTTQSQTRATLENDYIETTELYDRDILATATTVAKTYYTLPNGSAVYVDRDKDKETTTETTTQTTTKQTETTTTKFNADALYHLPEGGKYSSAVKYKVTSDTTYLNLRFGPSKEYSIQLQIPDGEYIYGTGETVNGTSAWVYVSYNGTAGWVVKSLLEKQ